MRTWLRSHFAWALALLILVGCGGEPAPQGGSGSAGAEGGTTGAAAPTKEALVALLEKLVDQLEAGEHEAAAALLVRFPGMSDEDAKQALAGFLERQEISRAGVAILAKEGSFGPLVEVFPDRAEAWAKKAGVDPAECWALAYEGAEVAVHAGPDGLRLIRLDDVGKL